MCETDQKTRNYEYYFFTVWENVLRKPRKLNRRKWVNCWLPRTKWDQIQQNFLSCTITSNIWENNEKKKRKNSCKNLIWNKQKSSVQVTVRFQNLKFSYTGVQIKRKFNKNKFSFKPRQRHLFKSKKLFVNSADVLQCMAACSN